MTPGALGLSPPAANTALAALAAAGAAYLGNRFARRFVGTAAIVLLAPGLEESLKTGAALLLGAPVLAAHLAFGGLEAAYDLFVGWRVRRGRHGELAGLFSARRAGAAVSGFLGHALFGALTVAVAGASASWPLGVAAAYLVHVGWNALVMGKVGQRA